MLFVTAVVALVVVALIVALVNFLSYQVDVQQAKHKQDQLAELYDFNPGDIISDDQFFNGSAMNEQQIQSFLDDEGANCTGDNCLATKTFDVTDKAATDYCSAYDADDSGKETAATIIYKTAQACSVSPKVLLTMLQKEQNLVTATDPTDFQFEAAMGLSCPDTDDCDPEYAGFFNQVYGSASRYQYYVANESQYGYSEHDLNYIQYNPDASCGGSEVYIENKATALLYIYTPYQPNIAALEAGAGEGDSCSTYGNRNFSLIYEGWFGDPRT
ncbi:hemagglutinin [Bifidobacterium sp. BRDM6]|uniref:Hemagglutinin n=2 Tax=Bifidobacterium choloepi TaxID=2614131 RepID=A0A6I5NMT0_9BIFI|nr:hemagglutinin [Bifidobacterium choloepi]